MTPVTDVPTPDKPVGPFEFDFSVPVYPATVSEPNLTASAAGVELRLTEAAISPAMSEFTICQPDESQGVWNLAGAYMDENPFLEIAGQSAYLKGISGTHSVAENYFPAASSGSERSCQKVKFYLGKIAEGQQAVLTIPWLQKPFNSGAFADALANLELQFDAPSLTELGIAYEYSLKVTNDAVESQLQMTDMPEDMTESEAIRILYQKTGYLLEGPWVFEIDLP